MASTYYSQKQAQKDKSSREAWKHLTLKPDKWQFMINGEANAIYLTNLDTDEAAWYPMLAGFQISEGDNRLASNTKGEAMAHAEAAREKYKNKLTAHLQECALLQ